MIDIRNEASGCLNCINAKCMNACPLNVRIPEINRLIKEGRLEEAFDIAFEDNPLGAICGIVCPHEKQCEGSCVKGIMTEPIAIGNIEEYLWKWKLSNLCDNDLKNTNDSPSKIKVAVVGGGPAGIACASYLLRRSIDVTIYEKENYLGGILIYGIPNFRLDSNIVKKNIDFALSYKARGTLNIKYNNLLVAKGIESKEYSLVTLEDLEKEYDYIFIAIGLEKSKSLGLTDDNNKECIIDAHSFLKDDYDVKNKRVVVIGGGNVAIDSARKAVKEGANATIIYRRRREDMPANNKEIEEAIEENVKFIFTTKVLSIKKDNDLVLALDDGSIFNTDYLVEAIGSAVNKDYFDKDAELTEENYVKVNDVLKLSGRNIFVGGDLVGSKQTVANAVHTGINVAKMIVQDE